MEGFVHRFDLNEALSRRDPDYFADQMKERPHQKIVVRIRLSNLSSVPSEVMDKLTSLLLGTYNMELESRTDMVIISGIPPFNGFGPQKVVKIVKKHVEEWSDAELAKER